MPSLFRDVLDVRLADPRLPLPRNTDRENYFPLGGGLDLVTPAIAIPPGRLRHCLNFEPYVGGGYLRTPGYERYDGGKRPSEGKVSMYVAKRLTGTNSIGAGDTLGESGGTAYKVVTAREATGLDLLDTEDDTWVVWFEDTSDVISDPTPFAYAEEVDVDRLVAGMGAVDSTWEITHTARISELETKLVAAWKPPDQPVVYDFDHEPLRALRNGIRNSVESVSGSANNFPVKGAWRRGERTFAWCQDDATLAAEAELYVSEVSASGGWAKAATDAPATSLCIAVKFYGGSNDNLTAGASEWVEGTTVKIGADFEGVIRKVIDWSGSYTAGVPGDAAGATGYLAIQATNDDAFAADDWIAFSPYGSGQRVAQVKGFTGGASHVKAGFGRGGTFHFVDHNFFGDVDLAATHGVTGKDRAFVLSHSGNTGVAGVDYQDDQFVMPIVIPVVSDLVDPEFTEADEPIGNPIFVEEHRNQLFLAYPGGRFVSSNAGQPMNFSALLSAALYTTGEEITGMLSSPGGVLVITTETRTYGLFGPIGEEQLRPISREFGARSGSLQHLNSMFGLSDGGIMELLRVDDIGDFDRDVLSRLVTPLVKAYRRRFIGSAVIRSREQYIALFDASVAGAIRTAVVVMYYPKKDAITSQRGTTTAFNAQFGFLIYPTKVNSVVSVRNQYQEETLLMATDDPYLYELGVGTSFDGDNNGARKISAFMSTPFTHSGSPARIKSYRSAALEFYTDSPVELSVSGDLNYDESPNAARVSIPGESSFGEGRWDLATWEDFRWDGRNEQDQLVNLGELGGGHNISIGVSVESDLIETLVMQGVTLQMSPGSPVYRR